MGDNALREEERHTLRLSKDKLVFKQNMKFSIQDRYNLDS